MNIYSYYDTISDPCAVRGTGIFHFTGGFHMMKRPMATEELFSRMQTILKAKDRSPDIFGYSLTVKFTEQR